MTNVASTVPRDVVFDAGSRDTFAKDCPKNANPCVNLGQCPSTNVQETTTDNTMTTITTPTPLPPPPNTMGIVQCREDFYVNFI